MTRTRLMGAPAGRVLGGLPPAAVRRSQGRCWPGRTRTGRLARSAGGNRSCDAFHSAEGVQGAADTDRLCEALQARDPSAATPLAVPADRAGLADVTPRLAPPCGQVAGVEAALAERVTGDGFGVRGVGGGEGQPWVIGWAELLRVGHGLLLGSGSAGRVNGQDLRG